MEAQIVELTAEQLDALTSALASAQNAIEAYGMAIAVCAVVCGFFLAFEIAAFVLWNRIFRE